MLYRELKNWEDSASQEMLVFFAQRLDELSFQYTLDSHRPPTATPPTLIIECLNALMYAEKNPKALTGALHLLEELEVRVRGNIVAESIHTIGFNSYFQVDKTNPSIMIKALNVLKGELKQYPYALKCFELIQSQISSGSATEKKRMDFLCRELVGSLINLGVSSQWINDAVVKTFFQESVPHPFDMRAFFKEIFPHNHKFTVLVPIFSQAHFVEESYLKAFRAEIFGKDEVDEYQDEASAICSNEFDKVVILKELLAKDPYSAIEEAKKRVSRLHHVYGLFNHKNELKVGNYAYAVQKCCREISGQYSTTVNRMQFVRDQKPQPAARSMERMMRRVRLPGGADSKKFFNAVSFHGLSNGSTAVENQLVNIWTALETITPESYSGSTISNVTDGVVPFVGLNYMTRLTRALLSDLLRWNKKITIQKINSAKCNAANDLLEKFFCLLALSENKSLLGELITEMGDFHLLRFRTFTHHEIVSSRNKIREAVSNHERRVSWQIHRIYRTRNLIVHRGQLPSFTQNLVINAHDYFDQVFEITCELGGGDKGYPLYETIFDFAAMRYKDYQTHLASGEKISEEDSKLILWKAPKDIDKGALLPE